MITPELSAQIVRDYLLPMFESKGATAKKESVKNTKTINSDEAPKKAVDKTIKDQLKLTVRLFQQNEDLRN